ncbi:MAG: DUF5675 family protein [Parvibaculum sp.]
MLRRLKDDGHSTLGALFLDDEWACDVLEDTFRPVKKMHETRIPAGRYKLELKPIGASRFDESARAMLGDAHKGMIRFVGVPGFSEVLLHWGNFHWDTSGCPCVGYGTGFDDRGHFMIKESRPTYKRVYPPIAAAILAGECWCDVIDGDRA